MLFVGSARKLRVKKSLNQAACIHGQGVDEWLLWVKADLHPTPNNTS